MKGDLFVILGSMLYACSNVTEVIKKTSDPAACIILDLPTHARVTSV